MTSRPGNLAQEAVAGYRYAKIVEIDASHLSNIEAASAFTAALLDFPA